MQFNSPPTTPRKNFSTKKSALIPKSVNRARKNFENGNNFCKETENDGAVIFSSPNVSSPAVVLSPKGDPTYQDRFIPNRKEMDFDLINNILVRQINDENKELAESNATPLTPTQCKYTKRLNLLKPQGSGSKLLVFSENKKNKFPAFDHMDLLSMPEIPDTSTSPLRGPRALPNGPSRILDAPDLVDDYYLNLLSWSKSNIIAVALRNTVYLWNAFDGSIKELCSLDGSDDCITSVQWSAVADNTLAVGTNTNVVELWDASRGTKIRQMGGHSARISSLSWNNSLLSSGGRDSVILNHDTRQRNHIQFKYAGHQQEVCGLAWSLDGTTLASGGNENLLCLWDLAMSTRNSQAATFSPRVSIMQHQAAVKALAWCPFQRNTLASGGGTADRTIRIWNSATGANLKCVDTGSQVCAIQWSDTYKELVSSHGFSDNQLCLWKYPTMTKVREFRGHNSRVLHMSLSPDGNTVVSAGADETIRFWEIFGNGASVRSPGSSPFRPNGGKQIGSGSSAQKCISGGLSLR